MTELEVVHQENVQAFDEFDISTDHRLTFEDGELSAVYPSDTPTTKYVVAIFNVEEGTVDLPEGAAVLEATDTVVALVPADSYGGGA